MFTTKAALLAASGPSTYNVNVVLFIADSGPIESRTYKMKIGETITAAPEYLDGELEGSVHGGWVELNFCPAWVRVDHVNYGYTVTLISRPQGATNVSFEVVPDGGG